MQKSGEKACNLSIAKALCYASIVAALTCLLVLYWSKQDSHPLIYTGWLSQYYITDLLVSLYCFSPSLSCY